MSLDLNKSKVRAHAKQATTDDLLDQVTVYRLNMEAEALEIIADELRRRNISEETIKTWASERARNCMLDEEGTAQPCTFCHRPAEKEGWAWQRLWGVLPVFPRWMRYCSVHQPGATKD